MVVRKRRSQIPPDRSRPIRYRTPDGPSHALEAAISILGPYPWKRPDKLEVANWIVDIPEIVTVDAIQKQVRRIGTNYLGDLEVDAAAIRVKDAFEIFSEIADLAEALADRLAKLSEGERWTLLSDLAPGHDDKIWSEHIQGRLPSIFSGADGKKLSEGTEVEWLRLVGEHIRFVMQSLASNQKSRRGKTGDLGGKGNLNRLRRPSPSWGLVKMSWQLFEWVPHCQPSGTAQGLLHEFMCHVHEWVTGENVLGTSKFESHLKAFPKHWQHKNQLMKEYTSLKNSLPEELGNILDVACSGLRPDLREHFPDTVLDQADELRKKLIAAQRVIQLGPLLASRL